MTKSEFKLTSYIFNQYMLLIVCFLFLWLAIEFFKNPVDVKDTLTKYNLILNGIEVTKKEGLEFASFNNCTQGAESCPCRVLVHGIGDNYQNWGQVLKRIKKNQRVQGVWVAFNYPGTGQSDPFASVKGFHVKRFANSINEKIQKICSPPYDVIANSMGTWISFWWAIQHPQKIRSLFLMDAVGIYSDYTWLADVMINPTIKKLKELHQKGYYNVVNYPEIVYENTLRNIIKRGNKQFILAQDTSLAVNKYLSQLNQKTFIGWGDADKVLPKSTYKSYLQQIPNAEGRIFKDCGHVPNSECPEQVVESLEKFYLSM